VTEGRKEGGRQREREKGRGRDRGEGEGYRKNSYFIPTIHISYQQLRP